MIRFLGLNFYWYGLIIGGAIIIGLFFAKKKARTLKIDDLVWRRFILLSLVGGMIGARLHHFLTDYQLYQNQWWRVFLVWRGGLSIIGVLWGGALATYLGRTWILAKSKIQWAELLDVIVYGLIPAQVVGRIANWLNYELVGLPTNLPWGIFLPVEKRPTGYRLSAYFHPIFFYEMVLLVPFWFLCFWLTSKQKNRQWLKDKKLLAGQLFISYMIYYSIIRFFLDFIRIDKIQLFSGIIGLNQLIFLIAIITGLSFLIKKGWPKRLVIITSLGVICVSLAMNNLPVWSWKLAADHSHLKLKLSDSAWLTAELAKTPDSREQGLGQRSDLEVDGMLFVFSRNDRYRFWMKNMSLALDFIWIKDQRVVELTTDVQPPVSDTPSQELMIYQPMQPVDMVLELPAGQVQARDIQVGDRLFFKFSSIF